MPNLIPKIFHQIWLQGEMPEPYQYFRDHMLELHPGWEYKFWTYENRPKLKNEDFFNNFEMLMFKSDLLRYELLYEYGGVYLDTDILLYKNIEELLVKDYFIVKDHHSIQNCIMGFSQKHYVMQYAIMKVAQKMQTFEERKKKVGYHFAGLECIGPVMIDSCLRSCVERPHIYDKSLFFPVQYNKIKEDYDKEYPESFGIHLFNSVNGLDFIQIHKTLPCYKRKNP